METQKTKSDIKKIVIQLFFLENDLLNNENIPNEIRKEYSKKIADISKEIATIKNIRLTNSQKKIALEMRDILD